jgi:hypothetical protein
MIRRFTAAACALSAAAALMLPCKPSAAARGPWQQVEYPGNVFFRYAYDTVGDRTYTWLEIENGRDAAGGTITVRVNYTIEKHGGSVREERVVGNLLKPGDKWKVGDYGRLLKPGKATVQEHR